MVDLPRVMRGILHQLLDVEDGVDIVGETRGDVDLSELVHATRVDVVVIRLDDAALPPAGKQLLTDHPGVLVVGMVADGRDAVMYELRPHREVLVEVSPAALVGAVRSVQDRGWIGNLD